MSESCRECQLLQHRVAQHRGDLQRAARQALRSQSPYGHREATQIKERLRRAQRYLLDHHSVMHRAPAS